MEGGRSSTSPSSRRDPARGLTVKLGTPGMAGAGAGIDLSVQNLWDLTRRLVVDLGRATTDR
jgi:hypothetical protein